MRSLIPIHEANRWVNCNGSAQLIAKYPSLPDEKSEAKREGIAFHWLVAFNIREFVEGTSLTPDGDDRLGMIAPNGVVVDKEMRDGAADMVNNVLTYVGERGSLRDIHVEESLPALFLPADIDPDTGEEKPQVAVPDAWLWDDNRAELIVWEGKYGHRFVPAYENWQLILYARAIMDYLGIDGLRDQSITVRLRVYQPRCYHGEGPMREWVIRGSELRAYVNIAINAAEQALSDGAVCNVGKQCIGCNGRRACRALQDSVYSAIDWAREMHAGGDLKDAALALELRILRRAKTLIDARLDGLEEQAESEFRGGNHLPGFCAQQTKGREKWRDDVPPEDIAYAAEMMGINISRGIKIATPKQAADAGLDASVIKEYTVTGATGFKLVEDDGTAARQAFRKQS